MKTNVGCLICALALSLGCTRQPASSLDPAEIAVAPPRKAPATQEQAKDPQEAGAPFPADGAGKLLSELLQPEDRAASVEDARRRPSSMAGGTLIERVEIPVPEFQAQPPRLLPTLPETVIVPGSVLDEPALPRDESGPSTPEIVQLPTVSLMRWPSPDQGEPAPLPLMALPRPDPAPFTQPSASSTAEAALAGIIPMRTTPTPFMRHSLPDPFENRQSIRLREALPEDPTPRGSPGRPGP